MIPWLQTHTGKKVFPFKLTLDDIDLVDIAYSLSHQARYLGQCCSGTSCAQHCILSARALFEYEGIEDVETHLQMLFHEDRVCELIFTKFNIRYPFDPIIKTVDHRILFSEKRDIHVPSPEPWNYPAGTPGSRRRVLLTWLTIFSCNVQQPQLPGVPVNKPGGSAML